MNAATTMTIMEKKLSATVNVKVETSILVLLPPFACFGATDGRELPPLPPTVPSNSYVLPTGTTTTTSERDQEPCQTGEKTSCGI